MDEFRFCHSELTFPFTFAPIPVEVCVENLLFTVSRQSGPSIVLEHLNQTDLQIE